MHHEKHWAGRSTSWNQDDGRNVNNLRYADDTTLKAESKEELKSLSMKVKEESEKDHSAKASILRRSAFFIVQLSHPYLTTGKTIAFTRRTLVSKGLSAFEYAI